MDTEAGIRWRCFWRTGLFSIKLIFGMRQIVAPVSRHATFCRTSHKPVRDYNKDMDTAILSASPGHTQLRRLVTLRNIAVAAQLLTLAAVQKYLELELDWQPMLTTIAVLAGINMLSWLRLRSSSPVANGEWFTQLCVDVLALSVLLYYGGGSTNPFISLYLLPLVIAAATLPARYTWGMAALTIICYSVLMNVYIPLPHIHHGDEDSAFNVHVMGMWLGFVISALVVAYFVVRMAQAVRQRDEILTQVREEMLRNERIVALGTQAAGAAHELGTPLSTMAVVIGELQRENGSQTGWRDALQTLEDQVRGCKRILDKMLADAQRADAMTTQSAEHLVVEVLSEWQLLRPAAHYIHTSLNAHDAVIKVDATLRAALMNLLNNAADAAASSMEILTRCSPTHFMLEIYDHGAGLDSEAERKAGSAFFTTKKEGRGLGLLLANATVERMGGTVRLFNRESGGVTTQLILPLAKDKA